ncbi:MAG: helix-turn-helix transcriptional regulator [Agathobacter sp.]|nr:helix-turn-helix transcriptional regulator [Agathobacter sp.]
MILADKIIQLRKKNSWSQEELAELMGVSRQAVCKWEGAQSIPDINRLIQLSKLFNVSIDYLLKDEIEEVIYNTDVVHDESVTEEKNLKRYVSMEEANAFLQIKEETSGKIAFGVFLCILSPIVMFLLAGAAEGNLIPMTEDMAGGLGVVILLLMIAPAVAIFIQCGMKTSPYEFLKNEEIETQYGVTGMVKERREHFRDKYMRNLIIGVILCIFAAIPLFGVAMIDTKEFYEVISLCLTFLIAAIGVVFIVKVSIPWEAMKKLLQEGDYSIAEKAKKRKGNDFVGLISGIYWLICVAFYLGMGFIQGEWGTARWFWPIAGVLFPVVLFICELFGNKDK